MRSQILGTRMLFITRIYSHMFLEPGTASTRLPNTGDYDREKTRGPRAEFPSPSPMTCLVRGQL
jgi:hypothetical protein